MRAQFAKTMLRLGESDPSLVVLVGDIGAFGMRHFAEKFPGRFLNVGIREQTMASAAAGFALTGFTPVFHSIAPFVVERCFEQIKVDFCYHKLAGNVVSVGAGLDYSALGGTHHCYSDIALMKSLPETRVFTPGTPKEFDLLFERSYRLGGVNYFRLGGRSHDINIDDEKLQVGKSFLIEQGQELTIITMGSLLDYALKAKGELPGAEIIYTPSVKPLDAELICASVKKTKKVLVIEDHSVYGGLADEVRRILQGSVAYKMTSLGIQDTFLRDYGDFDYLAKVAGIDPHSIIQHGRKLMENE